MYSSFTCLHCKAPLYGRSDKKFCDDGCRNLYHNKRNRIKQQTIRNINRILARNYSLLKSMEDVSQQQFTREDLVLKGFNFKYFTSIDSCGRGISCYWIYDKAYYILKNGHIALLQNSTTNDSIKLPQAETATLATAQHNGTNTHRSRVEHNH